MPLFVGLAKSSRRFEAGVLEILFSQPSAFLWRDDDSEFLRTCDDDLLMELPECEDPLVDECEEPRVDE